MSSYKKVYLVAAAFFAVILITVVASIVSIFNNPTVAEAIQLSRLKEYLGKNYSFELTADVGDVTYELQKNEAFAKALSPASWTETEEKPESVEPLLTLNFGTNIHYTFYPDGYIYALYSGEIRTSYVPIKKDTQFQAPAELSQELLNYVLQNGTVESEDDDNPMLTPEECLERVVPITDVESIEQIEVISQELITWAQYDDKYEALSSFEETDALVWVFTLRYTDNLGNVITKLVVADATVGFPLEGRTLDEPM